MSPSNPTGYWEAVAAQVRETGLPIVFGGDLVSFGRDLPAAGRWLESLKAREGSIAVLGNHEHWTDPEAVSHLLRECGFKVLRDQAWGWPGQKNLGVYGTDDFALGRHPLPGPPFGTTLLVCHSPDRFFEAARLGYPAVICGHTHGGQIHLPPWKVAVNPSLHDRLFTMGGYSKGETQMWIGQGLGAYPFFRLGPRPEILHVSLKGGMPSPAGGIMSP